MFSLFSKRKKVLKENYKLIDYAISTNSGSYEKLLFDNMEELNSIKTDEEMEQKMAEIRREYYDIVNNTVKSKLIGEVKEKFEELLNNPPEIDGYEDLDLKKVGISADVTFVLLNYAVLGELKYDKESFDLSHKQNKLMTYELEKAEKK